MGVWLSATGLEVTKTKVVERKEVVFRNPPKENEILVLTEGCGVCNSDVEVFRGDRKQKADEFGHEGYGKVVKAGAKVSKFKVGDTIATYGHPAYCDHTILPEDKCVKIPSKTSTHCIAQPVASVLNAVPKEPCEVLVYGSGFIGILFNRILTRRKFQVEQVGNYNFKQIPGLKKKPLRKYYPLVIEASGRHYEEAIKKVAVQGTLISFATPTESISKDFFFTASWNCVTIENPSPRNEDFIQRMEEAVKEIEGKVLADLISHEARFNDLKAINNIFTAALTKKGGYIKGVVVYE